MAISDWPEGERPRERLLAHGPQALSDAELLAIYLRVGVRGKSAVDLARELLQRNTAPTDRRVRLLTLTEAGELAERVLLQSTSRPEAWHEWFLEQGLHSANSYHGPRFDTFYMCVGAAQSGCGVALVPRNLEEQELAEVKLEITWPYAMRSSGAYFVAFAEHAAEVPKVRSLVEWIREQATAPRS